MLKGLLIDATLRRYGLPPWMKEYVQEYLKGSDISAVKYAISFISVGRKKGAVTRTEIVLPNGKKFRKDQIAHLLSLFYYGECRLSRISWIWSIDNGRDGEMAKHFGAMHLVEERRARAIKNLIEAFGYKIEDPSEELKEVFDYVEQLKTSQERVIAKRIFLNYAYAQPFGQVFYKAFYPVSPEYMRSFGKEFSIRSADAIYGERVAENAIIRGEIGAQRLLELATDVLVRVARSIDAELPRARRAGIEREALLLRNIAIAYPFHRLKELGVDLDAKKEIANVKRKAR
ncbi:MAG: hypothetical protein LVQ95_00695 [Candidatus Micrarchaeales archaeon]|nr:hypothetical protein [Candidatus Micrarchaeales archaeon]